MLALAPASGGSLRDASALTVDHAGAESNTALGLARLGLRVAWVSRLGADPAGDRILDALTAEGVDTRWVRRDAERPTGLMLKEPAAGGQPGRRVRYYRTGSAASVLAPDDLEGVPLAEARAVMVSGVTALIGEGPHATGLTCLRAAPGLRIFDPNLRDGLWGSHRRVELVRPYIAACSLLIAGAEELIEITSAPAQDPPDLARLAAALGPSEVVVRAQTTLGVLDAGGAWHTIDIRRDQAVDAIGAGDAFNAGYIAVRLRGGSIDDALAAGARCGAAVTQSVSDTAGFPRSV